jgi:regulator of protease activity HflC (stomatin/prohibitin superfamily)
MFDPNKGIEINSKYFPLFIFLVLGLPILIGVLGKNAFIVLILVVLFYLRKIIFKNFDLKFFVNNLLNKNNMFNQKSNDGDYSQQLGGTWKVVKILIIFLVVIWAISWSVVIVDAGETGVVSLFGKVRDTELRSGFHLINPLAKVEKMSIRTEQYTMSLAPAEGQVKGDDSISSLTKEGLDVSIDFTALYRLDEQRASDIYREVGLDYVAKLIRPEIRGVIRDVVSQYEAKELYSEKRQEASGRIASLLKERVEPRGIIIEEAVIRNVQLPPSLAKAIQEKLASEQEAQRYDFVLAKEKKEAERKIIEAGGQRDAQKIINEGLSAEYLNYLYIKELKDRQGTIYVPVNPANGMPLFKGIGQ